MTWEGVQWKADRRWASGKVSVREWQLCWGQQQWESGYFRDFLDHPDARGDSRYFGPRWSHCESWRAWVSSWYHLAGTPAEYWGQPGVPGLSFFRSLRRGTRLALRGAQRLWGFPERSIEDSSKWEGEIESPFIVGKLGLTCYHLRPYYGT